MFDVVKKSGRRPGGVIAMSEDAPMTLLADDLRDLVLVLDDILVDVELVAERYGSTPEIMDLAVKAGTFYEEAVKLRKLSPPLADLLDGEWDDGLDLIRSDEVEASPSGGPVPGDDGETS